MKMFQVRIVTVDHYMSSPISELDVTYSDFRKSSIKHVPVIRIFGTTPSGIKTCVHIHGVFPYICIPYDGAEPHLKLSYKLAASLDKAINIASGFSTSNTQHVYKVVLVSGIPFYGYHHKRHQFLKVYFYKPSVIKQAVNLLQNGAILNKVFQPHEAHIPFILQFFIDFNLYGMSFIDFQHVKYRRTNFQELLSKIPAEHILPDSIRAVSSSQFEVDAAACFISNRPSSQGNAQICNPGIAAIWEDENRRRSMKEGTPVDVPHLHSQRPPQNSTSSELFYLDKIQRILNNPSQSSDDSSLSGELSTLVNKSYAIEEPPNTSALDASFVSLHVSEPCLDVQDPSEVENAALLEDTIVDEDIAAMNSSISQHLTQPLDNSLALDLEDLELLDVLETLADTRSANVDDDSVLGSQTSKTICRPSQSAGNDEEENSDGEDERWEDKTLVAEEDDHMKLFDLTMPDVDENLILNELIQNEPQPGPSTLNRDTLQIPQSDGNCDVLTKGTRKSRKNFQIPQVDGVNDLPSKSGRKSLGIRVRGGTSRQQTAPNSVLTDGRFIPGTNELIFKKKQTSDSAALPVDPSLGEIPVNSSLPVQSDPKGPCSSAALEMYNHDDPLRAQYDAAELNENGNIKSSSYCDSPILGETQIAGPSFVLSTIENTVPEQEPLLYILPSSEEEAVRPGSALTVDYQNYIQPPVACCTSTVGCSEDTEEPEHCTDTFIDLLANKRKEPILRGDPSLYPQAPLDKEESLTELISSVVSDENNLGTVKFSDKNQDGFQEPTSTSVRRSVRLSIDRKKTTRASIVETKAPDSWDPTRILGSDNADELVGPDGNMTPRTISDISVSSMEPLLTTTMFNDIRDTLDWGSSNTDASCSDNELNRLKDALDNDEMGEILSAGSEHYLPEPSTSRREELIRVISESSQSSNQRALEDPVTDELLHRGELPRKGPPKLGKNMQLAQFYCGRPISLKKHQLMSSRKRHSTSNSKKELKRVQREKRRLKLSVSAQRKIRTCASNEEATAAELYLKPCSVRVVKLTKKNIYNICKKFNVVLEDKSALGIKSHKKLSTGNLSTVKSSCSKNSPASSSSRAHAKSSVPSCGRTDKSSNSQNTSDLSFSRACTKSSVLSCGRTRRSFSTSELRNISFKAEGSDLNLSHESMLSKSELNSCGIEEEKTSGDQAGDQKSIETSSVTEQSTSHVKSLRNRTRTTTDLSNSTYLDNNQVDQIPEEIDDKIPLCQKRMPRAFAQSNSVPIKKLEVEKVIENSAPQDVKFEEEKSPSPLSIKSRKATPQKYVARPGSKPTSIKISCKTLQEFDEECGKTDESVVDQDDVPLSQRSKKQRISKSLKMMNLNLSTDSSLDQSPPKTEDLSCLSATHVINTSTGQRNVEVLMDEKTSSKGSDAMVNSSKEEKAGCKESKLLYQQASTDRKTSASKNCDESIKNQIREPVKSLKSMPEDSPTGLKRNTVCKSSFNIKLTSPNNGNQDTKTKPMVSILKNSQNRPMGKDSLIGPSIGGIISNQSSSSKAGPLSSRRASNSRGKEETSSSTNFEPLSSRKASTNSSAKGKPAPLSSRRESNSSAKGKQSSSTKLVPLSSRRASELSATSLPSAKPIPTPISAIIPEAQCSTRLTNFKIPKKTGKNLKEGLSHTEEDLNESTNDSLLISLDTSSIDLELNSSSDAVDENVLIPVKTKNSPSKNYKRPTNQIVCVDGASTESSSNSSSTSQETSETAHQPLKRKIFEEDFQQKTKVQRDDNQDTPNVEIPGPSRPIPKSVIHWFDKRYGPWTMWSPNISPDRCNLDGSPPVPISPDICPESNFSGFAPMRHGFMGEMEENNITTANEMRFGQDLLKRLKSIESKDVECGRNLILQTEDNTSRKSSQSSIVDMFSERSIDVHEENKTLHDMSPNISHFSSLSLLESKIDLEKNNCIEQPFSPEKGKSVASSQPSVSNQEDIILSCESSDIPCGQDKEKGGSGERVAVKLPSDFKTLQKPPSRKAVLQSLPTLNLPEVVIPEPYFSNYHDVKGKVDVGSNVLELTSHNCLHLEEFHSSIDGLRGLSCQQKQLFAQCWGLSQVKGNFNHMVSTHCNKRVTVISPVKKPPKVKDVAVWARAREMALKAKKKEIEEKETNLEIQSSVNPSSLSVPAKLSQAFRNIEASTPEGSIKKHKGRKVPSPLLTPILTRSQSKANRKSQRCLETTSNNPTPLISIDEKEESEMGVSPLEMEGSNVSQSNSPNSSSIKRLLQDSQFCKDAASPLFRHDPDASACQIKGIAASPGFKMVLENLQTAKTKKEHQYITILTMEVHICTCGALNPDPERDPIRAIFYSVCNDVPEDVETPTSVNGIIVVNSSNSTPLLNRCGISGEVEYVNDEKSLLQSLVSLMHKWDPDILAGFEIEMLSWGYVLQRANVLGVNIIQEFSRVPDQKQGKEQDLEDNNGLGGLKIIGRIVLDAWRLFRSEVALQSYTFENLMYHILHKRVSHHSFENLSRWWEHPSHLHRWITVQYYQQRVSGIIRLLDQLDLVGRTSELARLFGIQFFEVLSRGSQFRVESMMLRLAKPLNFIPVSPSVQQRAHMRAPECLPLIMEPESRFYNDPMIVLDFQSLYPSMIIAYNYCFSTCLGRVEHLGKSGHFEFGCSELRVKTSLLQQLRDEISVSPSGIAFVTKRVRQGVLPRMLEEILEARLAVKQSMKLHKKDHTLQRVLHARQLGLKLIANVTYGYTSANFSGRMPCIEVGDSVVSKGRETLERAITLVQNNKEWRARVVYGDTDSLFVLIPGRSREEAFRIGAEIAAAVTESNPSPVKLKLEKVYQPCILQTKKRYVGFMYESPDQAEPVYEAKGIETVRRDGCPAVAKMLEKSLKILFETRDVSSVKAYVSHQFSKILAGRANIQDLIFAREYRGKENYRAGACVPALELTKRWLRHDRRSEPRMGERVPYVVTNGPPGSALIHLVRHPKELLSDPSLRYNAVYYVTRAIIPPLARCFSLLGADVLSWYSDLPRRSKLSLPIVNLSHKKTISQYFTTMECACCGDLTHGGVCVKCQSKPQLLVTSLMSKLHNLELTHASITKICQSCLGRSAPLDCSSLDCPITYRRHQSSQKCEQSAFISQLLNDFR
ncbi:uncharacterized protein LOC117652853 [Thrips palmi]|uniref:DNA polymerase zeta catalytic subunit n=1 Tax=Thrips palmi TaxID=161013 RepID=A0A6P9ADP6_THRPL|nr:uncharacterized protein LOC117652853 [Thrips palmi]XP_034253906.1 uncharacterized protein LOC117652853 [Thrips palmi]